MLRLYKTSVCFSALVNSNRGVISSVIQPYFQRFKSSLSYDSEDEEESLISFRRSQSNFSDGNNKTFNRQPFQNRRFKRRENRSLLHDSDDEVDSRRQNRGYKMENFANFSQIVKPTWDKDSAIAKEVQKHFYTEQEVVQNRSQTEVDDYLRENEVTVTGTNVPRPVFSFNEIDFPDYVNNTIRAQNWDKPTPIQAQSLPIVMSGRDMVGRAKTGSGKTAAFVLPAIVHIKNQLPVSSGEGPICLVLCPTRELAQQIGDVIRQFGIPANVHYTTVYGGASRNRQLMQLRKGPEICIATPGRLLDFLSYGDTNMFRCSYLVLDEADRMLDMGFEPQIRKIIEQTRPDRQTVMWSATWPEEVQDLASDFMSRDSVHVMIGSGKLVANENIKQIVDVCTENDKVNKLYNFMTEISKEPDHKTLIFVQTKKKADYLARIMRNANWPASAIHGDKGQERRDYLIRAFRSGECEFLIATDVASRGLDVSDVKYVINYDMPMNIEDYIHRIGRTARANNTGVSYTLFTESDSSRAKDLVKILTQSQQTIPDRLFHYVRGKSSYSQGNRRPGFERFPKSNSRRGDFRSSFSQTKDSRFSTKDWYEEE